MYSKFKAKQGNLELLNKHRGIPIYLYSYNNNFISSNFVKYDSINNLSKNINVARDTIKKYLNTHVPYNNFLYYTYILKDLNLINGLIYEATKELVLQPTKSTEVWIYKVNSASYVGIENLQFQSKEAAARF